MGTDECIERAARVSYGYGTRKQSVTRGLLRYLRRHKHTTPSEMVELKFHCCMPMFIARQWIRHRTAIVNEYSGRYSLMPMLFYTPDDDAAADAEQARTTRAAAGRPSTASSTTRRSAAGTDIRARQHRRVRLADGERGRARAGAHRPAAVDVHAVVLEDRPAQPAALPDAAGGLARAVGDPGVRARDGGDAQARRAAVATRRGSTTTSAARTCRAPSWRRSARWSASTATARRCRARARASTARRWRGTAWPSARSTSCWPSWRPPPAVPDFELDVASARSGEHFAERFAAAVPSGEKPTE